MEAAYIRRKEERVIIINIIICNTGEEAASAQPLQRIDEALPNEIHFKNPHETSPPRIEGKSPIGP